MKDYEQWAGTITALGDGDKKIGSTNDTAYPQYGGTLDLGQAGGKVEFHTGCSIDHKNGVLKPAKRQNIAW